MYSPPFSFLWVDDDSKKFILVCEEDPETFKYGFALIGGVKQQQRLNLISSVWFLARGCITSWRELACIDEVLQPFSQEANVIRCALDMEL